MEHQRRGKYDCRMIYRSETGRLFSGSPDRLNWVNKQQTDGVALMPIKRMNVIGYVDLLRYLCNERKTEFRLLINETKIPPCAELNSPLDVSSVVYQSNCNPFKEKAASLFSVESRQRATDCTFKRRGNRKSPLPLFLHFTLHE